MPSVDEVVRSGGNATIIPTMNDLQGILESVTGPFFLGFAFEYMGMGVILMLGIHYFVSLSYNSSNRPPNTPTLDSQTRLGPTLVFLSILFNLVQTILDMVRGWNMFALDFMDLRAFATPDYMWFASPFLGLFPALITQIFLLRRITLFLSSLSSLWPALDRPVVKMAFVVIMSGLIIVSFVSGCIGTYWIWKGGPLWEFFTRRNVTSYVSDLVWLSTSSAVDIVLSMVLSLELWWARRKLASKGGLMAKVTWQLLLVTFHGGLAVTGLQLTALFLFEYKRAAAFCYLPILFIYTLTLILSLTLPQAHQPGHAPSHVFSLPNLESCPNYQDERGNGNVHRNVDNSVYSTGTGVYHRHASLPVLPPLELTMSNKAKDKDKRKSTKSNLSSAVARSWRLSQDWLSWSLISSEDKRDRDSSREDVVPSRWKIPDTDQLTPPSLDFDPSRRPSEPNSLAPLLPHGPRSSLSLNSYPTISAYGQPEQHTYLPHHYPYSHSQSQTHAHMQTSSPGFGPPTPSHGQASWAHAGGSVTSPSRSITVSRSHSFSTGSTIPRRSSVTAPSLGPLNPHIPEAPQHRQSPEQPLGNPKNEGFRFDTPNPFGTYPRHRATLAPIHSESDEGHPHVDHTGTGDEGDRPPMRARLMSFEDMLSGPPIESSGQQPRKGSRTRRLS